MFVYGVSARGGDEVDDSATPCMHTRSGAFLPASKICHGGCNWRRRSVSFLAFMDQDAEDSLASTIERGFVAGRSASFGDPGTALQLHRPLEVPTVLKCTCWCDMSISRSVTQMHCGAFQRTPWRCEPCCYLNIGTHLTRKNGAGAKNKFLHPVTDVQSSLR